MPITAMMRKSTYPLPLLPLVVLVAVWMTSAARWTAEGFTTAFTVTVHSGSCCRRCAPKGALLGTTRRESFGEILGSTLLPGVVAASSATVATGCAPQPANAADSYGDEYPFRVSLIVLCCSNSVLILVLVLLLVLVLVIASDASQEIIHPRQ